MVPFFFWPQSAFTKRVTENVIDVLAGEDEDSAEQIWTNNLTDQKYVSITAEEKTFEKNALAGSLVKTLELNSVPKFKKGSLKTGGKLTIIVHLLMK
ncbi:MAG: hypothetical protein K6E18_07150 [Lachnospiraceae bacterium]|nr:hypothetical protein [Lachnospiraceae bacterium]